MTQVLRLPSRLIRVQLSEPITDQELLKICADHRDLHIEQEADGTLLFMSPITNLSGDIEAEFIAVLKNYSREYGGQSYSSQVGFRLPDGSLRSPDACYLNAEKVAAFTEADLQSFIHKVPDFVVEVRSKSDSLKALREKMRDTWINNGVRLGWLVDMKHKRVFIYRSDREPELVDGFAGELDGEEVLPGFTFDLGGLVRRK